MITVETFAILISSTFTLLCYSMIYKDNKFYKLAEHILVGLSIGYAMTVALKTMRDSLINPFINGDFWLLIPLIFGISLFARFSTKYSYISRFGITVMAGVGSGVAVRTAVSTQIIPQILLAAKPINLTNLYASMNQIIVLVGIVSTLTFFIFTFIKQKSVAYGSKIGRFFLMATFGTIFAGDLYGNVTFVQDRVKALVSLPSLYLTIIALIVILIDFVYSKRRTSKIS